MGGRRTLAGLLGAALLAAGPAPASARGPAPVSARAKGSGAWGRPFRLAAPQSTDVTPATLAFGPRGVAGIGYGLQDEDNPSSSAAFLALLSPGGTVSASQQVPGVQQALGLAFAGADPELLAGTSPSGETCCTTVEAIRFTGGAFAPPQVLSDSLTGATSGALIPMGGGSLLATFATDRGVWVSQARGAGSFGPARRVSPGGAMPWTLAVTPSVGGRTNVAWTETRGQQGEKGPTQIMVASGSRGAAPGRGHTAVTAASGRRVGRIALAPRPGGGTLGWTETWFDRGGRYHGQVVEADLGARRRRSFSEDGRVAAGLAMAGDGAGNQVLAWKACTGAGDCQLEASVRPARGSFGQPVGLGAIDPGQSPAAAIGSGGRALVGWTSSGHVLAAAGDARAARFARAQLVSATNYAADLVIAFAPGGLEALAAWTQGTLAPDVVGAVWRG